MSGYLGLGTEQEHLTFGGFIAECAQRHGDADALVYGDVRLSFTELERQVREFARALLAAGVVKGSSVALMLANRPEFVVACFAAGSIGAVVVPVSTFAPADERDYILRHSDASLLVIQQSLLKHRFLDELVARHPALGDAEPGQIRAAAFPFLRRIVCLEPSDERAVETWSDFVGRATEIPDELLDAAMAEVHPRDPGIVIYTSGTSANPKGVVHANSTPIIASKRWSAAVGHRPSDVVLSRFPYFWSGGFAMTLGAPLNAGATVLTVDAFDAGSALELIEREQVTVLQLMPESYAEIVEHEDFAKRDLSSLNMAVGAESLIKALPDREWRAQGNGYGLTETFTLCTWANPEETGGEFRTVHGRVLPGVDLRIVDTATGETLPTGELGEIAVKGVGFMLGYQKAYPEEYLDPNGLFRTGDSGSLDDDGVLHWGGRMTEMIKTAGANVSPEEVRAKVLQWGRLKTFGVVPVPHPRLDQAVVLCAVRQEGDPVTAEEITAHLKTVLASYKVPKRIVFLTDADLTYTASEKVKLQGAQGLAARSIVEQGDDPEWAAYLRESHPDLLQKTGG